MDAKYTNLLLGKQFPLRLRPYTVFTLNGTFVGVPHLRGDEALPAAALVAPLYVESHTLVDMVSSLLVYPTDVLIWFGLTSLACICRISPNLEPPVDSLHRHSPVVVFRCENSTVINNRYMQKQGEHNILKKELWWLFKFL